MIFHTWQRFVIAFTDLSVQNLEDFNRAFLDPGRGLEALNQSADQQLTLLLAVRKELMLLLVQIGVGDEVLQ